MTSEKILCVDDDEMILFSIQKDLRDRFPLDAVTTGKEALEILEKEGPFGVIVADMMMPEMNGIEVLARAQRIAPETVRIMLTGDEEKQTAVEAINEGRIFRFLSKPCPPEKLIAALESGLEYYRLVVAERELLEQTLNGSVKMLTELLSAGEPEVFGRGQKVREYVRAVAPALGLTQTWDIEVAAMLAQLGYMTIPTTTVQKLKSNIALTDREKEIILRIPEIGYTVLSQIPRLGPAAEIVLYQNKNFDGTGFPKENSQEPKSIPKGARLLRILYELDAFESRGVSRAAAFDQMRTNQRFFDMPIFETVKAALLTPPKPIEGSSISMAQLVAGDELTSAVVTLDGRLIAPAGTVISPMMLERFHNFAEISGIKEPIIIKSRSSR